MAKRFQRLANFFRRKKKEKRSLGSSLGGLWPNAFGFTSSSNELVNVSSAMGVAAYWRCIDIWRSQIASLPLRYYRIKEDGTKEEAKESPLHNLLSNKVMPWQTTHEWLGVMMFHCLTEGEAFSEVLTDSEGKQTGIRFLKNELVSIGHDEPTGFVWYRVNGRNIFPEDIIHIKWLTWDGLRGVNPLLHHRDIIGKAISEVDYAGGLYANGGIPPSVLMNDKLLSPEQKDRLALSFGSTNFNGSMVERIRILDAGTDIKQVGADATSSNVVDSSEQTVRQIGNIFGIPAELLNSVLSKTSTQTTEQLVRLFVSFGLRPWVEKIEAELNSKLVTRQNTFRIEFDLRALLKGDIAAQVLLTNMMYDTQSINPNEIRINQGLNPYPGGNEYGKPRATNVKTEETETEENGADKEDSELPGPGTEEAQG